MARQVDFNQRSGGPSPRGRIVAEDFGIAERPWVRQVSPKTSPKRNCLTDRATHHSLGRFRPNNLAPWVE